MRNVASSQRNERDPDTNSLRDLNAACRARRDCYHREMRMQRGWAVVLWIAVASCGGDDSSGSGGAVQACQNACARLSACNVSSDICAPGGCELWTDRWRPEFSSAYFDCLNDSATPCTSAGAESCVTTAFSAIMARPADTDYRDACLQKRTACSNPYPDDDCLASTMLSDAWLAKAQACLAEECAAASSCIQSIFKP